MNRRHALLITLVAPFAGCAVQPRAADTELLRQQVADAEIAFAQTMADRDHAIEASTGWRVGGAHRADQLSSS